MAGALAISRLQNIKAIFLHRELEVLHVLEVTLKDAAHFHQLLVRRGHFPRQIGNRMRCAHACDDVFALRIDQILAVKDFFAGRWITRKCNPRCACLSHVPEHHRLHIDRRSPIVRDSIPPPIHDGPIVHPRAENSANCAPELFIRILGERFSGALFDQRLETLHEFFQIRDGQSDIRKVVLAIALILQVLDHGLERLMVFARPFLNAHHHIAVHLQKAPIRIPGETRVARFFCNDADNLVVHPEIENRVHHAGHGIACARSHGNKQRPLFVPEFFAHRLLNLCEGRRDLRLQFTRVSAVVIVKVAAHLCRDCESRRDRQAYARHLVEVCAFATQQRLHAACAVSMPITERVDVVSGFPFAFAMCRARSPSGCCSPALKLLLSAGFLF